MAKNKKALIINHPLAHNASRMTHTTNSEIEIRVAFADTDAMGIAHHSNYLRYFEVARVAWLRNKGQDYRHWITEGLHMPLVETSLRYKKPARFDDVLMITMTARFEKARVIFEYEIKNKETKELLTTGSTTHVAVNDQLKIVELPEKFKQALK